MSSAGRVLVTGATGGIGRVVAKRLAHDGHAITVCARDSGRLTELIGSLAGGGHRVLALDVADTTAWARVAPELDDVTGIVCAAGAIGPIGDIGEIDAESFVHTLRVNVVGTLMTIQACAPALRACDGAVVVLSGGGATGPFARFDAYAASKAAVVRLVENLAAVGLRVNAVAPGFIVTEMQSDVLDAGRDRVGHAYYDRVQAALEEGAGDDPERAAALIAFLLSDGARGIAGRLLSAPWDPWEDESFRDRLRAEPNLGTLRRIDDQFFRALEDT